MRILLTAAAGFLGSNLSHRLLDAGHEVVGVDNFTTGTRVNIDDDVMLVFTYDMISAWWNCIVVALVPVSVIECRIPKQWPASWAMLFIVHSAITSGELMPNEITGANTGEPRQSAMRTRQAARVAQFGR